MGLDLEGRQSGPNLVSYEVSLDLRDSGSRRATLGQHTCVPILLPSSHCPFRHWRALVPADSEDQHPGLLWDEWGEGLSN